MSTRLLHDGQPRHGGSTIYCQFVQPRRPAAYTARRLLCEAASRLAPTQRSVPSVPKQNATLHRPQLQSSTPPTIQHTHKNIYIFIILSLLCVRVRTSNLSYRCVIIAMFVCISPQRGFQLFFLRFFPHKSKRRLTKTIILPQNTLQMLQKYAELTYTTRKKL